MAEVISIADKAVNREGSVHDMMRSLFDAEFYALQLNHLGVNVEGDLVDHFFNEGFLLNLDPNVSFSCSYYLEVNADVRAAKVNPYFHFLDNGQQEERVTKVSEWLTDYDRYSGFIYERIKKYFDVPYYMNQLEDGESTLHPVLHYLNVGSEKSYNPSRFFSSKLYQLNVGEMNGMDPLVHYEFIGRKNKLPMLPVKGAGPHDYFDAGYYLSQNEDVKLSGIDPFGHFMDAGWREGRDPSPYFSTEGYLKLNPDVKEAGINPLLHYSGVSQFEGRKSRLSISELRNLPIDIESHFKTIYLPSLPVEGLGAQDIVPVIHIHCYYIDVFEDLLVKLAVLDLNFRLIVTSPHENDQSRIKRLLKLHKFTKFKLIICPNIGRDLAPLFVDVLPLLKPDDVVLHIHTKKSVEKESFGKVWLDQLCAGTVNNTAYVLNVLKLFSMDEKLGVVAPQPMPEIRPFMTWGNNKAVAKAVLSAIGIQNDDLGNEILDFPAGSFFWFRPKAFALIEKLNLTYSSFPEEPIPDDGTLAHVLERIIFNMSAKIGMSAAYIRALKPSLLRPLEERVDLSVIVPYKNAERWLTHCVQSILLQDTNANNVEIILVDNNSSDGGRKYADLMSVLYPQVLSISEKRVGVGATRNKGLELAKGEYVMFVDADDVILPSAVTDIMSVTFLKDEKPDFVTSCLRFFSEDFNGASVPHGDTGKVAFLQSSISEESIAMWSRLLSDFGACAKVYKKEFLDTHKIRFPEKAFEDNYFVYKVLSLATSHAVLSKTTYLYRKLASRNGSTESTQISLNKLNDQLDVINEVAKGMDDFQGPIVRSIATEKLTQKLLSEAERIGLDEKFLKGIEKKKYLINAIKEYGDYPAFQYRLKQMQISQ